MATLRVTEETPTKLVLEMVPQTSSMWAVLRIPLIITLLFLIGSVLSLVLVPDTSLHWLFWIVAIGSLLLEAFFLYALFDDAQDATVTIDLISKRATRIEKFLIGREKKQDLELEHVSHVLVNAEEVGHHSRVMLESQSNPPLEVNFAVAYGIESMKALGKKIGHLLKKPVVFKHTDSGNLISEETIQSL